MKAEEAAHAAIQNGVRQALLPRMTPSAALQHVLPIHHKDRAADHTGAGPSGSGGSVREAPTPRAGTSPKSGTVRLAAAEEGLARKNSERSLSRAYDPSRGYTPFLDGHPRHQDASDGQDGGRAHVTPMRLPESLKREELRAVASATIAAMKHSGSLIGSHHGTAQKARALGGYDGHHPALHSAHGHGQVHHGGHDSDDEGEGGGHGGPSWNRLQSTMVLLGCTVLYAALAGKSRLHSPSMR